MTEETSTYRREGLYTPFGPPIGYYRLADGDVEKLNGCLHARLEDNSQNLVGKVDQELAFDRAALEVAGRAVGKCLIDFKRRVTTRPVPKGSVVTPAKYDISIKSGWFVRQFAGNYNPLHVHANCQFSCVGYLKMPEGIAEEWVEDAKDHAPAHGQIHFTWGMSYPGLRSSFMVRPEVGDFFVFPNNLHHCVYPFSSPGERRSFSMNVDLAESDRGGAIYLPD